MQKTVGKIVEPEEDLTKSIVGEFEGSLVFVDSEKMSPISLSIIREQSCKVRIVIDLPIFSKVILFGKLSTHYEGIMIYLDRKALPRSIIVTGVAGVIDNKSDIHGALLNNGNLVLNLKLQDERMKESSHISILCNKLS